MAEEPDNNAPAIRVTKNGSYEVTGSLPLVRKSTVESEHGEPLAWKVDARLETEETYYLCRCGHSGNKPFCDGSHRRVGFDGAETADTRPTAERQVVLPGGRKIVVRRDYSLCSEAGFCGNRFTNIEKMMAGSDEGRVQAEIIGMVERCPSGSYTYSLAEGGPSLEPDLPRQVAVTTEMSSDGPIMGPLWVTGNIQVERSDGQPLETRNRVALCRCGLSKSKPLCDGAHRTHGVKE